MRGVLQDEAPLHLLLLPVDVLVDERRLIDELPAAAKELDVITSGL